MDTQHFKQKLEAELETVDEALADTERLDIDKTATEPDEIADRFEDQEEKSEERVALEARKLELEAALGRIETGTYGKCRECGAAIEEKRLAANPAATTCLAHTA